MAMFGLGHYIYAGEDVPDSTNEESTVKWANGLEQKKAPRKATKAEQDKAKMIAEMVDLKTHPALNETSVTAIAGFLDSINNGTPDEEIGRWYNRILEKVVAYDLKEKEKAYIKEHPEVVETEPKDMFDGIVEGMEA